MAIEYRIIHSANTSIFEFIVLCGILSILKLWLAVHRAWLLSSNVEHFPKLSIFFVKQVPRKFIC